MLDLTYRIEAGAHCRRGWTGRSRRRSHCCTARRNLVSHDVRREEADTIAAVAGSALQKIYGVYPQPFLPPQKVDALWMSCLLLNRVAVVFRLVCKQQRMSLHFRMPCNEKLVRRSAERGMSCAANTRREIV